MKINLKTERLNIRLISELDIGNVYNLQCLEETAKFNTAGIPQNIYETSVSVEKLISDNSQENIKRYTFVVELIEENKLSD